jgi:hypothetical protein
MVKAYAVSSSGLSNCDDPATPSQKTIEIASERELALLDLHQIRASVWGAMTLAPIFLPFPE